MAGAGKRLLRSKYSDLPKPFISVRGRPMAMVALASVKKLECRNLILVALSVHKQLVEARLGPLLRRGAEVIYLNSVGRGQLTSALAARGRLGPNDDLLIIGADTYVSSDIEGDIASRDEGCRGLISVSRALGDRWSFASVDSSGRVVEVAEKRRISDHACAGLYYFARARDFLNAADAVLQRGERLRGEYYVIQVYEEYLRRDWFVGISRGEMWDMGTPDALEEFLAASESGRLPV